MPQTTRQTFGMLYGGLNVKATDVLVNQSAESPLESPELLNVEFDKLGGVAKRKGEKQQGAGLNDTVLATQSTDDAFEQMTVSSGTINVSAVCQKVTPGSNFAVSSFVVRMRTGSLASPDNLTNLRCVIKSDNSGDPGTTVTNGESVYWEQKPGKIIADTPSNTEVGFYFQDTVILDSGTDYWFCIEGTIDNSGSNQVWLLNGDGPATTPNVKYSRDNYATFSDATGIDDLWYKLYEEASLLDYQPYSDLSESATVAAGANNTVGVCFKYTASATASVSSLIVKMAASSTANKKNIKTIQATIKADSSGSPGSTLTDGTSTNSYSNALSLPGDDETFADIIFSFGGLPSLVSGTTYWICVQATVDGTNEASSSGIFLATTSSGSANIKTTSDNFATFGAGVSEDIYYKLVSGSSPILGLGQFNYEVGSPTVPNRQYVFSVLGGEIFYQIGPPDLGGVYTSLKSGLGTGQNNLYDMATANNRIFITDYATNTNQWWNEGQTATSPHGYQPAFTLAANASATGAWTATGSISVMLVTTLASGGYRAKVKSVTISNTNDHIDVTSVNISNAETAFGTEITDNSYSTDVFVKTPGLTRYHKLTAAQMGNEDSDSDGSIREDETDFDILGAVDATLDAQDTLLDVYGLDDEYFTLQVSTPKFKFMTSGDGFLFGAGDPTNPSRLWISALNAPHIWSEAGGTDGSFIEVGAENDGQSIQGIKHAMGALFVFKNRDVWRYKYTGNASLPFQGEKLASPGISATSHFAIEEIPDGLIFISGGGFAITDGVRVVPFKDEKVGSKFEFDKSDSVNKELLKYAVSVHNENKKQVWFLVASKNSNSKDLVYIYDYQLGSWYIKNGNPLNFVARISDADGYSRPWGGDYSARVIELDRGTNDMGASIPFEWKTPWIVFGDVDGEARLRRLSVKGDIQGSGTLYVEVYVDYSSTAKATFSFDMTDTRFSRGLDLPINYKGRSISLKFLNAEADTDVQIQAITLYYQNLGGRR